MEADDFPSPPCSDGPPPGNEGSSHEELQPGLECKTEPPAAVPGLVTPRWVEEAKKMWGSNSTQYQVRVLGEFPSQSDDTLIPLMRLEQPSARSLALRQVMEPYFPSGLEGTKRSREFSSLSRAAGAPARGS